MTVRLCSFRRCFHIITAVFFFSSSPTGVQYAVRFFGTFSMILKIRCGNRRTGKATFRRLVNPPFLVNPPVILGRIANVGGLCWRGRGMKEKELRSTRIANYPWKQAAVNDGTRSRWHWKLLRSSIAHPCDPPGSRFRLRKGFWVEQDLCEIKNQFFLSKRLLNLPELILP